MRKTGRESINLIDVRHCSGYNFAYQTVCEMGAGHHTLSVKQVNALPATVNNYFTFETWFIVLIVYIVIAFIGVSVYDKRNSKQSARRRL